MHGKKENLPLQSKQKLVDFITLSHCSEECPIMVACDSSLLYSRVEWFSTLFWFSKTYTILLIRHIFWNSIPKNWQFWPSACTWHAQQSFHFQKITGTSKFKIYLWKLVETFLVHQRTINKNKVWNKNVFNFFLFSKKGQNCFCSVQGPKNISLFFAFKKIKECVPPCHRLQKRFIILFLLILGEKSKFSEALWPRKEASETFEILELGSNNNLA